MLAVLEHILNAHAWRAGYPQQGPPPPGYPGYGAQPAPFSQQAPPHPSQPSYDVEAAQVCSGESEGMTLKFHAHVQPRDVT